MSQINAENSPTISNQKSKISDLKDLLKAIYAVLEFIKLSSKLVRYNYNYEFITPLAITNARLITIKNIPIPIFPEGEYPTIKWIIAVVIRILVIQLNQFLIKQPDFLQSSLAASLNAISHEIDNPENQESVNNIIPKLKSILEEIFESLTVNEKLTSLYTHQESKIKVSTEEEFQEIENQIAQSLILNPEIEAVEAVEEVVDNLKSIEAVEEGTIINLQQIVKDTAKLAEIAKYQTPSLKTAAVSPSLDDYNKQFKAIAKPDISYHFQEDKYFAYMQVAGPNPLMLQQIAQLDSRLPITENTYSDVAKFYGVSDTLNTALAEGRIYLADYTLLLDTLVDGSFRQQKYISPPLALFAVPPNNYRDRSLFPVAISLRETTNSKEWKLFTPLAVKNNSEAIKHNAEAIKYNAEAIKSNVEAIKSNAGATDANAEAIKHNAEAIKHNAEAIKSNAGATDTNADTWMTAKNIVQMADSNYHELVSHLGRTHLVVEPFVVATNKLPKNHPLKNLLKPHLEGTVIINYGAHAFLIAPEGGVDELLAGKIESSQTVAVKAAQSYLFNFNDIDFPNTLKSRGVDDASKLPTYPYRDDGLLIWGAIESWVREYFSVYYKSDLSVSQDNALQTWGSTLNSDQGGRLQNFGNDGKGGITTINYLVKAVSTIIFTASAQHAAVNFSQKELMMYTPAFPLARYLPTPTDPQQPENFINGLPPLEQALEQINLLYLLGSVYYTNLGNYSTSAFTDPNVTSALEKFQTNLKDIEQQINQRNSNSKGNRIIPYEFLLPTKIPQSINI